MRYLEYKNIFVSYPGMLYGRIQEVGCAQEDCVMWWKFENLEFIVGQQQ